MTATEPHEDQFAILRQTMVEQVALHADHVGDKTGRGEIAGTVMAAIGRVPRHAFVPRRDEALRLCRFAFADRLRQDHLATLHRRVMTDLLEVGRADRVLEIGTGLGYQAALLAELAAEVFTVEVIGELAESGRRRLVEQGYGNVYFRTGDGSLGWPDHAPFDRIIATAAPDLIRRRCCSSSSPAAGW